MLSHHRSKRRRHPVAVRALIATAAVAALFPLTAVPASAASETPGAASSLSAADITAVDSTSDQIRYTGGWETSSSDADHNGSIRYLSSDGSASYAFSGTSVAWATRLTPSSGTTLVSIDGEPVATVDGYAKEPVHKHPAFVSETLPIGEHTITLARTGQKNPLSGGTNTIVDGFAVIGAPDAGSAPVESAAPEPTEAPEDAPAPQTTAAPEATQLEAAGDTGRVGLGSYENTSSAVTYSGDWRTMDSGSDSGGSSRYLNSTGSASISFTGTAVRWVSRVTPSSGIANVYIDGSKVASVDRYSKSTAYQKVVFERTGLSNSTHSIKIVWTGNANSASSGTNLILDRFVVPDVAAPAKPTGVTAYNASGAVGVKWNAGSSEVASYRIYGVSSTGAYSLIGQASKSQTSFTVLGVPSYQALSYSVTAVDSSGNESAKATKSSIKTGVTPAGSYRYDNCPTSTVTVHNKAELEKAAGAAKPGTVIKLASGTYYGQMNLIVNGAAGNPVWICGPRDAVIDGTGISKGKSPIELSRSSHVVLTGFTATNGLKGVTVRSSHHVTVSDLLVENIGYEGVHLRSNTTDSVVVGNTIRKTGVLTAKYGEGVYIGSSDANWCNLTDCEPDRSDRNAVVGNAISLTSAELIEAKEGTTGGVIRDNTVDGTNAMSKSDSWIMVSGNAWSVTSNTGKNSSQHGLRVSAHVDGWGKGNLFAKNSATVNAPGYGFKLYEPNGARSTGTLVSCSNTVSGADSGFSTVSCTR